MLFSENMLIFYIKNLKLYYIKIFYEITPFSIFGSFQEAERLRSDQTE